MSCYIKLIQQHLLGVTFCVYQENFKYFCKSQSYKVDIDTSQRRMKMYFLCQKQLNYSSIKYDFMALNLPKIICAVENGTV